MDTTATLYENPEATDKQNSSSKKKFKFPTTDDGVHFPANKRVALEYQSIGANISLTKGMMNNLVLYHQSIGADKDLPTSKGKLFGYMNRFHLQLAVQNPYWPEDMSFGFVYGSFLNRIVQGQVELNGFNVSAHIKAFKRWITQSGVEDNLRDAWYGANPDKAPRQLGEPDPNQEPTQRQKEIIVNGYVDMSPAVVKKQVEILKGMWDEEQLFNAFPKTKGYVRRLFNTKQKYKQEDKWPES